MFDPLHTLYRFILSLIDGYGAGLIVSIIRLLLFFGIPTLLTMLLFQNNNTSLGTTWTALILGAIMALETPLGWVTGLKPSFQLTLLLVSSLILYYLPRTLSFFLVPELGQQLVLRKWLYRTLVLLLTISLISL